jgi:hypothetical protein
MPRRHGVGLAHLPEDCQLCRCNRWHRVDAIFGWGVVHHIFERARSPGHPARPLDSLALARPQAHAATWPSVMRAPCSVVMSGTSVE